MEILVILILFLLNGIFAMYEIALVSSRKSLLEDMAKSGKSGARTALNLLKEPEKILSAIQVGITLVGIISGAYGGVAFTEDLAPVFRNIDFLAPFADTIAFVLIIAVITYFSLIIGELVPKTIALNNPEAIATFLSPAIKYVGKFSYPIVWLLSISTKGILALFRIKSKDNPPITEDELRILLKQSSDHGIIEKEESVIIKEVIRIGDKTAREIMTPRINIEWIDSSSSEEEILQKLLSASRSRIPVCDSLGNIVHGIAVVKDALSEYILNKEINFEKICNPPLIVTEQLPVFKVIERFRLEQVHIGVVVDEYGAFSGIITLHDLIENIIGDIPDIEIEERPRVITRDDGTILIDGSVKIDDLQDILELKSIYDKGETNKGEITIAGFAMRRFEEIPSEGDKFETAGYVFEVIDMDGNRIDKLLASKKSK